METTHTYSSVSKAPPALVDLCKLSNVPKAILKIIIRRRSDSAFRSCNDIGSTGKYRFLLTQ